jgi:hypothetical protein
MNTFYIWPLLKPTSLPAVPAIYLDYSHPNTLNTPNIEKRNMEIFQIQIKFNYTLQSELLWTVML